MEGQKFSSTILISEENLISYGLGVQVEDPVYRIINIFDVTDDQTDMFLFLCFSLFFEHFILMFLVDNPEMKQKFA